jgi:hypothetical protein
MLFTGEFFSEYFVETSTNQCDTGEMHLFNSFEDTTNSIALRRIKCFYAMSAQLS